MPTLPARTDYHAERSRRARQPGQLAYVPPDPRRISLAASHGARTDDPGAVERAHRIAEREALLHADVTRLQAKLAEHDGLLGCEGWLGSLPDDDGRPAGYGTLPGPAQGYPLREREPRAAVKQRRRLLGIGAVIAVVLLVALACGWTP